MSQRNSGYARKEFDFYETPEWVTLALVPHIKDIDQGVIYEPAAGAGKIVNALRKAGATVAYDDISDGKDFLSCTRSFETIITNPPYEYSREFIEKSIELTKYAKGSVAMLLRTDYDHAKTRQHLFSQCEIFSKKIVLTKRIKWFENTKGQPSFNHAWFMWDWKHVGPPTLWYGP